MGPSTARPVVAAGARRTIGRAAVPMRRERQGTRHQFDRPFALDCSAYEAGFGEQATPFDTAVTETVRWWQERPAASVSSRS